MNQAFLPFVPAQPGKHNHRALMFSDFHAGVFHGDAFDLLSRLANESVDLLITSPPYWGHREYGLNHNWDIFNDIPAVRKLGPITRGYDWYRKAGGLLGLEPFPEWYVEHLAEIFTISMHALKPSGNLWVNVGDTYFARWSSIRDNGRQGLADDFRNRRKTPMGGVRQEKQLLLIPSRFAIAMQERGWILRNDLIWFKPNATPRSEGDRLKLAHEHFFHFVRKPKEGRAAYYYAPEYTEARSNDVVVINCSPGEDGHTATFPYQLIEPRILTSSPVGGVVLDPFCGTGRALEAAKRLGRKVIGFDAQLQFVELTASKLRGDMRNKNVSEKDKRNYVSEWFGQRIYPIVRLDVAAITLKNPLISIFVNEINKLDKCDR